MRGQVDVARTAAWLDELAAEHQAELDAQKKAFDAEIREIRDKTQAEIASQIRSRLLQLASKKKS